VADNIAITAGSGTTILADELVHATYGTGKAQAVKLLLGAPGTGVDAVGGTGAVGTDAQRVTDAGMDYETVAASQTAQTLGATGATGDHITSILVIPATTSPGNVLLLDNAISITVFTGGATSVADLKPFSIPLGLISVSGAWKITTGTNVSCIGIGNFT
jgi:hypothetical protein